jgi:hypothetical protein
MLDKKNIIQEEEKSVLVGLIHDGQTEPPGQRFTSKNYSFLQKRREQYA